MPREMNLLGGSPASSRVKDTKPATTIKLYHGSSFKDVTPTYGKGKDNHDYGRGFYLTPNKELAKEWAVGSRPSRIGWVHSYELDLEGLTLLDFEAIKRQRALYWVTELLQHREPDVETRGIFYKDYKSFLDSHYKLDSAAYDVVCGWRADDSYFKIVDYLLDDRLQVSLLEDALRLGDLGIQYCCRSQQAFMQLHVTSAPEPVPFEYRKRYMARDVSGRQAFLELSLSDNNKYGRPALFMRDLVFARGGKL